jgi:uncharacterized protein HemY
MSQQATVSVDRLTTRISQLETSNMALSGVVATVVAIAIFVMASVMVAHVSRRTRHNRAFRRARHRSRPAHRAARGGRWPSGSSPLDLNQVEEKAVRLY